ncbi:MAG: hypothetical protein K6T29_04680 [Peptococcaceae bacterium]|nr:hypothetical protein [Peptococcaceae bacterium]
MAFASGFYGLEGVLEAVQPPRWQTVHQTFLQRNHEVKVILPDGRTAARSLDYVASRWVPLAGERWELQLLNKTAGPVHVKVRWVLTAAERVCCFNPVEWDT